MRKTYAIILGSLILATLFGLFGQGMAYFLNKNFVKIPPVYYLTVLTIISFFLYFISFVITCYQYKQQGIKEVKLVSYFTLIGCIGFLTSCWSLFVLAMWWG